MSPEVEDRRSRLNIQDHVSSARLFPKQNVQDRINKENPTYLTPSALKHVAFGAPNAVGSLIAVINAVVVSKTHVDVPGFALLNVAIAAVNSWL